MTHNPFLDKHYGTPHNSVPFRNIQFEHFEEAMMEGIKREDADTERIVSNPEAPTFDNTIIPKVDYTLERTTTVFFNQLSACTNDAMDQLATKMQPILTQHANKTLMNEALWKRIKAVHDCPGRRLDPEEQTLLNKVYEGFARQGALLSQEDKDKLSALRTELSQAMLRFQQNELREMNAFVLHLTDESHISGLPDSRKEAAAQEAKERGLSGWAITLHQPSYAPFMTHADNRELRKRLYMARNTICTNGDNNSLPLVPRIVNLRRQIAQLLGYATYADFVLENRMAQNADNVHRLLTDLHKAYMPTAISEAKAVEAIAREAEGEDFQLMPWDFSYYSHKLMKQRYDIDQEMLRPYFELSRVKEGVFHLATKLYGITFRKAEGVQTYHDDVEALEVIDNDGTFLGLLYTDFHPRASKQSGAWMTTYKEQCITEEDGNVRPHASITMNFTKPTQTKPALLTLGEVTTLLHEFGHALHALFSQVRFESLSGTNVFWDFVELPSQFMENYALEPEFLNSFARHHETGEPLPQELIDRVLRSRHFMAAYSCIRQVGLAKLDMAYHTLAEDLTGDVRAFEKNAWADCQILPQLPETCMTVQFSHIMSGGYAAGYYSYKWAEVLDADAYAAFQERGIFDRAVAESFRRNILQRGRTEHPMTLYKRFRGQEPTIDALLKRDGING